MMQRLRMLAALGLAAAMLSACVESGPAPVAKPEGKVLAGIELSGKPVKPASLANPRIRYAGGDGSSLASAVVIKGASGEFDGVQSEYVWLAQHLPGWRTVSQAVLEDGGRMYDRMTMQKSGTTRQVYFDITGFYGRM